jgi:hypothetical protein
VEFWEIIAEIGWIFPELLSKLVVELGLHLGWNWSSQQAAVKIAHHKGAGYGR